MKSDDTGCDPGCFGAAGKRASIAAGAGIFAEKHARSKRPFKRSRSPAPPLQESTAQ